MTNKVQFEPSKLIFDKNCGEGKLKLLKVFGKYASLCYIKIC